MALETIGLWSTSGVVGGTVGDAGGNYPLTVVPVVNQVDLGGGALALDFSPGGHATGPANADARSVILSREWTLHFWLDFLADFGLVEVGVREPIIALADAAGTPSSVVWGLEIGNSPNFSTMQYIIAGPNSGGGTAPVSLNTFHHFAFIFRPHEVEENRTLYRMLVDGVQVDASNFSFPGGGVPNPAAPAWWLGRVPGSTPSTAHIRVRNLHLLSGTMTDEEVAGVVAAGPLAAEAPIIAGQGVVPSPCRIPAANFLRDQAFSIANNTLGPSRVLRALFIRPIRVNAALPNPQSYVLKSGDPRHRDIHVKRVDAWTSGFTVGVFLHLHSIPARGVRYTLSTVGLVDANGASADV